MQEYDFEQEKAAMARWTSLTRKGQVTIPKNVRDQLGLKPFDKIVISVDNGEAKPRNAHLSLEEVAGILPPLGLAIEDAIALAKEERALRTIERMRASDG
jgi:AbrB family looped-hinge helix DNA binding protein